MDTYTLLHDVALFGGKVATFPEGVEKAFTAMMQQLSEEQPRSYYGLSHMDEKGNVCYFATAEEKTAGEAERYGYEKFMIPKGHYLSAKLTDWMSKTHCIKDIFHDMMQDARADLSRQCIEWYKDDHEMFCLLQIDPVKELFLEVDQATTELMELLLPLTQAQINVVPFKDSWTAAQLATHITKSNNAILQAMDMEGKTAARKPTERIGELKKIFLDFSHKLKSPDFILPPAGVYNKETMLVALQKSNSALQQKRAAVNLSEVIEYSAFGQISRLELFYFVLFHTRRHIHQLKNIVGYLNAESKSQQ